MSTITDLLGQIPAFGRPSRKQEYQDASGNSIIELFPLDQLTAELTAPTLYFSFIQVNTTVGPTQVDFEIPAGSLQEACLKWRGCAQEAVKKFILRVEDSRRRVLLLDERPAFPKRLS